MKNATFLTPLAPAWEVFNFIRIGVIYLKEPEKNITTLRHLMNLRNNHTDTMCLNDKIIQVFSLNHLQLLFKYLYTKQGQLFAQLECLELHWPQTFEHCPDDTDIYICAETWSAGYLVDFKSDFHFCPVYKCCNNTPAFLEYFSHEPYEQSTGFQDHPTDLPLNVESSSLPVPVTVVDNIKQTSSCNSILSNFSIYLFIFLTAIAVFYCQY